jgi:hypothetical protein
VRQTLSEWMVAAQILLFGLIFVADYSLGWPASRTWPAALILWGAFRVAAGLIDDSAASAPFPLARRPSVFGPALLIVFGALLLVNNYYDHFSMTTLLAENWPWALVTWGGSWLIEDFVARASDSRRPRPLRGGSLVLALVACLAGMGLHGAFAQHGMLAWFDVI